MFTTNKGDWFNFSFILLLKAGGKREAEESLYLIFLIKLRSIQIKFNLI